MAVVPIKPGVEKKEPKKPDADLVSHFRMLMEAAERGEIQAYAGGWVLDDVRDNYAFLSEDEWAPVVCFAVRLILNELESPFE